MHAAGGIGDNVVFGATGGCCVCKLTTVVVICGMRVSSRPLCPSISFVVTSIDSVTIPSDGVC